MNIRYAISFCLVGVLGSTVSAQEDGMKPLGSILSTDFEISYIPMRCGGLYMSMASYAGEASLGAEQYINMLMGADRLIRIAAEIRTKKMAKASKKTMKMLWRRLL